MNFKKERREFHYNQAPLLIILSHFRGPEFAPGGSLPYPVPGGPSGGPEFVTLSLSGGPEFMPGTIGYFGTLFWPGELKFTSGGPGSITLSHVGGPEYVPKTIGYFVTLSCS